MLERASLTDMRHNKECAGTLRPSAGGGREAGGSLELEWDEAGMRWHETHLRDQDDASS